MKRIAIIAVVVVMMAGLAGSAFAANSLAQGSKGISVGMGDSLFTHKVAPTDTAGFNISSGNDVVDISGRLFIAKDVALYGGFGLQLNSGDAEGTYLSFTIGARKYLSTNDFAPFIGGQLSYVTADGDNAAGAKVYDVSIFDLAALFGAEYFFSKNFSLEGAIGFGLGQWNNDVGTGTDGTYFGTRTVGVHANFYF
jgi:hypothetical protein